MNVHRFRRVTILAASLAVTFSPAFMTATAAEAPQPPSTAAVPLPEGFDLDEGPAALDAVPIDLDVAYPRGQRVGPEDLSARVKLAWDAEKLYIAATIRDDSHAPGRRNVLWDGDALQFHLLSGEGQHLSVFIAGLLDDGPQLVRFFDVGGLPAGELTGGDADVHIRRLADRTEYVIALPWSQIPAVAGRAGETFDFSAGAIDTDSLTDAAQDVTARKQDLLQWTPSIFGGADRTNMGRVTLAASADPKALLGLCSEWASVSHPPALAAAGNRLELTASVAPLLAPAVETCEASVRDESGRTVATLSAGPMLLDAAGGMGWLFAWDTAGLDDGAYTIRTSLRSGEKTSTIDRRVRIRTEAISEIQSLLAEAGRIGRRRGENLPLPARRGLRTCIEQARDCLMQGRQDAALDCAQQARVWADKTDLQLQVPPHDPPPAALEAFPDERLNQGDLEISQDDRAWRLRLPDGTEALLDKASLAVEIRRGGTAWRTVEDEPVSLTFLDGEEYRTAPAADARKREVVLCADADELGFRVVLSDFPGLAGAAAWMDVTLDRRRGEFLLTVTDACEGGRIRLAGINWPGPMRIDAEESGAYWAFHSRSGTVVPAGWPHEIDLNYPACGYRMGHPYSTLVRGGRALVQFVENPYDAQVRIVNRPEKHCQVQVEWLASWGHLRYPRRLRLAVLDPGGYVQAAKWYRGLLKARGKFVSLEEKIARRPQLARLVGGLSVRAPNFSINRRTGETKLLNTFDEMAESLEWLISRGFDRGGLELTYWHEIASYWTEDMQPLAAAGGWEGFARLRKTCRELGWAFGFYDCYSTLYETFDSYRLERAIKGPDGLAASQAAYTLGPNAWLSPAYYLPLLKLTLKHMQAHDAVPDIYYLDTFIGRPEEDHDARHPATRYSMITERVECARYVKEWGCASKVEGESYIGLEEVDYPFWSPPPPRQPFGVPVPMTHLALHDSMFFSCHLRDVSYWAKRGGPMQAQGAFVRACLWGEIPYFQLYAMKDLMPQNLRGARIIARLHKQLGLREMLEHRFLSEDYALQETVFAGGAKIRADFREMTVTVEGVEGFDGEPIAAIPFGYDFDIDTRIAKTGPRAFRVEMEVTSPQPPEMELFFDLNPYVAGRRVGGKVYGFQAAPSDWRDGRLTVPPIEIELPAKLRDRDVEIHLKLRRGPGGATLYLEGGGGPAMMRDLGTVRLEPHPNAADAKFSFLPPAPWPKAHWILPEGPGRWAHAD
jgi:hypothetical protein